VSLAAFPPGAALELVVRAEDRAGNVAMSAPVPVTVPATLLPLRVSQAQPRGSVQVLQVVRMPAVSDHDDWHVCEQVRHAQLTGPVPQGFATHIVVTAPPTYWTQIVPAGQLAPNWQGTCVHAVLCSCQRPPVQVAVVRPTPAQSS